MDYNYDYSDAPNVVRNFLNYKLTIQGRSKLTVFNYYHDLRTFARFLLLTNNKEKYSDVDFEKIPFSHADDKLLLQAKSDDVYQFLFFATNTLNNNSTSRARKLSCLRSFYKYLTVTVMLIDANPTEKIESPKKSKTLPKENVFVVF